MPDPDIFSRSPIVGIVLNLKIIQQLENQWKINVFSAKNNKKVIFTTSVFAYYPFSRFDFPTIKLAKADIFVS